MARLDDVFPVLGREASRGKTRVRPFDPSRQLDGRKSVGLEPARVEQDLNAARQSANDDRLGNVLDLHDLVFHLGGELSQREGVVPSAPQRDGEDRHVVDGARLDEGAGGAGCDAIERLELAVGLDDRVLLVRADLEADDDEGEAGVADGGHILRSGGLPKGPLYWESTR